MSLANSSLRTYLRRFWFLLVCLPLVIAVVWYVYLLQPCGNGKRVYGLTVPKGAGFAQIAQELERQGIVRSALHLRIIGRLRGFDLRMQPGDYRLSDAMAPADILEKMASGLTDACKFAVPEGYSIFQVAELLEKQGIFDRDDFLAACRDKQLLATLGVTARSVEGYLFPGTYLVGFHVDERGLLAEMVREFHHRTSMLEQELSAAGLSLHQVVTLASMVEKEAVIAEEKPLIASVFRNRLKIGMPLQSDPTAIYGVRAFGGTVTKQDLRRQSPYNTYRFKGLPAGPIGSPGLEAIKAVLQPARTDYLYFVARKDGTHQFSRTLQEHNQGVHQFLKKGRKKNVGSNRLRHGNAVSILNHYLQLSQGDLLQT
ncbi:MAG: endolytic transglycosylase MltG [Trichlorobacter sp.]|jgi:UPF0755 protein